MALQDRILLIDDGFPRPRDSGFSGRRHAEFMGLLDLVPEAVTVCPPESFTKARDIDQFRADRAHLLNKHPHLAADRITFCENLETLHGDLAYCMFPHYAFRLLPFFEANAIPFTFTIYPGGGFVMWGSLLEQSERRLTALFAAPQFRAVFVHHRIIEEYLRKRHGLGDRIVFQKGGFSQLDEAAIPQRTHFGFERDTMNIGFVANRYDEKGLGKGYDVFIEMARRLAPLKENCLFHVVGEWNADVLDVSEIGDRIRFHGYLNSEALIRLYSTLDVIVSPTRIDVPIEGKFDGFPLVVDAGLCGVAMFVSDPLGQNEDFTPREDLEIIRADADDVITRLLPYFDAPDRLRSLARQGQTKMGQLRGKTAKLLEKAARLRSLAAE